MPGRQRSAGLIYDPSAGMPAGLGRSLLFGAAYIVLSASLIHYNKFLLDRSRFPFPMTLVLIHTLFCSLLTVLLYTLWPALFPSLTASSMHRVTVDQKLITRSVLPIAACFTAQMILSNTAYLHSSVAFLQMLKESNVILVYTFSLALALEKFSWRAVGILLLIMFATLLTIHGEMHFSRRGFAIQTSSQFFESTKIVLQSMLLSKAGKKLDALSYMLLVMPCSFLMLASTALGANWSNVIGDELGVPDWTLIRHWAPHLGANAMIAFALNLAVALFVKHCSAVAFVLIGILKDAMIVLVGGLILHEIISGLQVIGFGVQLAAIATYSLVKSFPEKFEQKGLFGGIAAILFLADDEEKSHLGKPQQREAFASLFQTQVQKICKDPSKSDAEYGATARC